MWIANSFGPDFVFEGPGIALNIFSILYAACCLIKFATETSRGYFHGFEEKSYLHFNYRIQKPKFLITPTIYKIAYIGKIVAAFTLFFSLFPKSALLVLILSFALEARIYFKYHVMFFLLMGLVLLGSPLNLPPLSVLEIFQGVSPFPESKVNLYPQLFGISIVTCMYLGAGWRKVNKVFLNGDVVIEQIRFIANEKSKRKHRDGFYPAFLIRMVRNDTRFFRSSVKCLMITTMVLEFALPALLIFDHTRIFGCVMGISMHLGFTLLFPATLAHFSLIVLSSYLLFFDPASLQLLFTNH